jgi:NIMA (never in mitosis gene a)-related kinase 1/4/5
MDFASDGDLFQKITYYRKNKLTFTEQQVWSVVLGAVSGLAKLHEMNIFHRDIKSANIFLNKDGIALLGDLNVSKLAKEGLLYTQTGTPYYASPEVWNDTPYNSKSDIWSLGCVLYETLTLYPPFRASDMNALYKRVVKGHYDDPPEIYSRDLKRLINSMIMVKPDLRPSC